ncbi:MAG: hypothetical protein A2V86_04585 [Deltaproteobacteria bacterium RBG_16_49_23]|nr:MAG: hypothetical protein A2V86_04585 [Deltaproteobacteria bacterium RBG_16_49_23]
MILNYSMKSRDACHPYLFKNLTAPPGHYEGSFKGWGVCDDALYKKGLIMNFPGIFFAVLCLVVMISIPAKSSDV